jgi:hypothetical protein
MHLVAVWAKDNKVANIIVAAVAVYMGYFQNIWYAKAAVSTNWIVVLKSKFSIIDVLNHSFVILGFLIFLSIETHPDSPAGV